MGTDRPLAEDRYGPDDEPETEAKSEETIEARDGEVSASVTIETRAPNVEAAGVLAEALASANRSIVNRVFSGGEPEPPRDAEDTEGEDGRIMDLPEDIS
jgi:hypothetical protein